MMKKGSMWNMLLIGVALSMLLPVLADASTLTTRAGKGSALTASELDANFKQAAQAKSGNYTVIVSDNRDTIEVSASATITLTAAATLLSQADTADFAVTIRNTHASSNVTISRSGSDTINGATSYTLLPGNAVTLKINNAGNGWNIIGAQEMPGFFANVNAAVTSTDEELNYVDVTTLGTAEASKAVTASAGGAVTINSGTVTIGTADINGGAIDGTTIGGSSAAAGSFTTVSASSTITASSSLRSSSGTPTLLLTETDAGTGDKAWAVRASSTALSILTMSDDGASGTQQAIGISRDSGTGAIDTVLFDNGNVDIDEDLNVDGSAVINGTLGVTGTATLATVDINAGAIDGTTVGASSAGTGAFTTLTASGATTLNGDTDLGNATSDTISATGRFDTDLVPSTDSARDLGTSSLQWAEAHIDSGFIDDIETSGDISHTKACATNYTRAAPGLCVLTTGTASVTNLTRDTCTSITFPTGSNYVRVKVQVNTSAAGSAGSRLAVITMYSDTGCSTQSGLSVGAQTEEVAGISANQAMAQNDGDFIIPNNSSYRIRLVDDTANKGGGWFNIPMYWDN